MSITQTLNIIAASNASSVTLVGELTDTGGVLDLIDESYADATTNEPLDLAFLLAGLQSIYLLATTDLTLTLNPLGTPQVIELLAGKPFAWSKSADYMDNPITANVVAAKVTCVLASRLQCRVLST